ncbi:MAG: hypothetical protein LBO06_04255 [Bacteroidales bacterium]|jgi:hypothetical protein|nr:hypothetical protein [Bacteroidales bacterium]
MKKITLLLAFFVLCFVVFTLLQNDNIYQNTLGKISHNYECNQSTEERYEVNKPFIKITNDNLVHWDASFYYVIHEDGYVDNISSNNFPTSAFFPLFPFIWRLINVSTIGIVVVNCLMFIIGVLILSSLCKGKSTLHTLLVLCLPLLAVFLIPYTEATFILMGALAIYGFVKDKYWLYFIAMTAVALTRNAFSIILPAIFIAEILFLIKERQVLRSLKRLLFGILPILIGTIIFSIILLMYGNNSIMKFMEVQEVWGNYLSLPDLANINDWSHEGFGINIATMTAVCLPIAVYLFIALLYQCKILRKQSALFALHSDNKKDYLSVVSLSCCLTSLCIVLFFFHGTLHGLSRYVLTTPYFISLFFVFEDKLQTLTIKKRIIIFTILIALSFVVLLSCKYTVIGFALLGFPLLLIAIGLFVFSDLSQNITYRIILFIALFANIVWTTYLFNMYISNGWIFT